MRKFSLLLLFITSISTPTLFAQAPKAIEQVLPESTFLFLDIQNIPSFTKDFFESEKGKTFLHEQKALFENAIDVTNQYIEHGYTEKENALLLLGKLNDYIDYIVPLLTSIKNIGCALYYEENNTNQVMIFWFELENKASFEKEFMRLYNTFRAFNPEESIYDSAFEKEFSLEKFLDLISNINKSISIVEEDGRYYILKNKSSKYIKDLLSRKNNPEFKSFSNASIFQKFGNFNPKSTMKVYADQESKNNHFGQLLFSMIGYLSETIELAPSSVFSLFPDDMNSFLFFESTPQDNGVSLVKRISDPTKLSLIKEGNLETKKIFHEKINNIIGDSEVTLIANDSLRVMFNGKEYSYLFLDYSYNVENSLLKNISFEPLEPFEIEFTLSNNDIEKAQDDWNLFSEKMREIYRKEERYKGIFHETNSLLESVSDNIEGYLHYKIFNGQYNDEGEQKHDMSLVLLFKDGKSSENFSKTLNEKLKNFGAITSFNSQDENANSNAIYISSYENYAIFSDGKVGNDKLIDILKSKTPNQKSAEYYENAKKLLSKKSVFIKVENESDNEENNADAPKLLVYDKEKPTISFTFGAGGKTGTRLYRIASIDKGCAISDAYFLPEFSVTVKFSQEAAKEEKKNSEESEEEE